MYTEIDKLDVDVHKKIAKYLKSKGISANSIAHRVDFHPVYVRMVLKGQKKLSDELRLKINEVLETDF